MNTDNKKNIFTWIVGILFGTSILIGIFFPSLYDNENVKAIFGGIAGILIITGIVWWVVESLINKKWLAVIGIILVALVLVLVGLARFGYIEKLNDAVEEKKILKQENK